MTLLTTVFYSRLKFVYGYNNDPIYYYKINSIMYVISI